MTIFYAYKWKIKNREHFPNWRWHVASVDVHLQINETDNMNVNLLFNSRNIMIAPICWSILIKN